ncbi:MAG: hypothetical protein GY861_10750 [bacterium]|nr:hypothetical protein [bacterium]
MKKALILVVLVLLVGCAQEETKKDTCTSPEGNSMTLEEAEELCTALGTTKENSVCNEITGTWWLDLDLEKEGCNPACVVNIDTQSKDINWRCTGLIS